LQRHRDSVRLESARLQQREKELKSVRKSICRQINVPVLSQKHQESACLLSTTIEIIYLYRSVVSDQSIVADLSASFNQQQQLIARDKVDLEQTDQDLRNLYNHLNDDEYELSAAFVHAGRVNAGHYYIFIRDFENNQWIKYNDEIVSIVTEETVISETTGSDRNAYLLVYTQDTKLVECNVNLEETREKYLRQWPELASLISVI
jgi:uncharacterized UBP type Zn finger protein